MTSAEIQRALREIAESIGPKAHVSISLSCEEDRPDSLVYASCYPEGVVNHHYIYVRGSGFEDALTKLRAAVAGEITQIRNNRIRAMALQIIETTYYTGSCSDAALRGHGFSQGEIDRLGDEAVTKANDLASRGPFSIERSANSNSPASGLVAAE